MSGCKNSPEEFNVQSMHNNVEMVCSQPKMSPKYIWKFLKIINFQKI